MEERQTQIREGAGLEESRLNTEFIEWLKKYSTPVLLIIAVGVGLYLLYGYYQKIQAKALDSAFAQYDAAIQSRNPVSLERIAVEESGRGAVPILARLAAADLHLEAYRTSVPAGIMVEQDGKLPEGQELLTDEARQQELARAEELYKTVSEKLGVLNAKASSEISKGLLHAIGAVSGLAAVAECRGKMDEAKSRYEQIVAMARGAGLEGLAKAAQKRIDTLGDISQMPRLYAQAEIIATPPKPAGSPIKIGPDGKIEGGGDSPLKFEAAPAPAPTPAPVTTPPEKPAEPAPTGEPPKPN